jgi:hypothetical protein
MQNLQPPQTSEPSQLRWAKLTTIAAATFLCGLAVSILFTCSTALAQTDASQIALQHPGWIRVPGALVRPDCVHRIPKGAGPRIENGRDTGDVVLHGNVIAHYDPCPEDATIRFAQEINGSSVISNSTGSGPVEASYWNDTSLGSSDEMDFVGNDLTVPSKPTTNGGLILLFNGLANGKTGKYFFAPALQYGANFGEGGNYWSIIAYFSTPSNTYLSPAETVNKGDTLSLFTEIYAKSSGSYDWLVEVEDLTTGAYTYQDDVTTGLHFNYAISGQLQVASLTSCSEFPASKAVFSGTVVDHGFPSYNKLSPKWTGTIYSYGGPACGFSVTPGNTTTLKY